MAMRVEERRRQYRASIPGTGKIFYQKKYDKAMAGGNPKAAIAAKCLDCMHWQRSRITECPIVCCPLWLYRPFTNDQAPASAVLPRKPKKLPRRKTSARRHLVRA